MIYLFRFIKYCDVIYKNEEDLDVLVWKDVYSIWIWEKNISGIRRSMIIFFFLYIGYFIW